MKVQLDGVEIFEIKPVDILLFEDCIENPTEDIPRRLKYVFEHERDKIFNDLSDEWVGSGKLADLGVDSVPLDREGLVNLITARPEYKNYAERTAE